MAKYNPDIHEKECDSHYTEDTNDCTCKPAQKFDYEVTLDLDAEGYDPVEAVRDYQAKASGNEDYWNYTVTRPQTGERWLVNMETGEAEALPEIPRGATT